MKTVDEIKTLLREKKSDVRLYYPTATVFENAPLALIQASLESEINILEIILEIELTNFKKLRK